MVAFSDQNSVRSHTMMDFEKIGSLWRVLLVELISPISGHTPEVAHSPAVSSTGATEKVRTVLKLI